MHTQLHDLVLAQAQSREGSPALSHGKQTLTYGDLWGEIELVANGWNQLGVTRGSRVAVYLEKRPEFAISCFAASRSGNAFVPVNPLLRPKQVTYILENCMVEVLVTSAGRYEQLKSVVAHLTSLRFVILVDDKSDSNSAPSVHLWSDIREIGSGVSSPLPDGIDNDVAAIFYTSGSTGLPKGVVLSHRNMVVGAQSVSRYLKNDLEDVILSVLPLSFDAGFSQLTTGFNVGAHVVMLDYLVPDEVIRACEKHSVTGLTGVPPLWQQLAARSWPGSATGNLRYFANTGGRMPKSTLKKLRSLFPQASPYLMYGLTEAFRSTYLDPAQVDNRPDSIGKAIPNAEILVVRPDGTKCDPGEPGELVHRGALVALGYWNDPERTAERFRPAPNATPEIPTTEIAVWSGDIVQTDEEGYIYFVGRNDEMIKTSGYRVSPTEIEEAVYDSGLVQEVAAFGEEDETLGQRITIVVSAASGKTLTQDELIGNLRQRVPQYMLPKRVLVQTSLPRSANGKLDRTRIREELLK